MGVGIYYPNCVSCLTLSSHREHWCCSKNCHTALRKNKQTNKQKIKKQQQQQQKPCMYLRGHPARFPTVKIMAECRQHGVDMTNAHWLKMAARLE